jgi:NTP pyrophosphatase (non-canonical NTP hydrolase)
VDWEKLVDQRNEWVEKNFEPGEAFAKTDVQMDTVLGCVEELGELAHAHLKKSQNIRGTIEEHDANAKDAIGDLTVYLLGVMKHVGVPRERTIRAIEGNPLRTLFALSEAVGTLCGRQSLFDVENIVSFAWGYCELLGWDYEEIVHKTWEQVRKRDWKANPQDGGDSGRG